MGGDLVVLGVALLAWVAVVLGAVFFFMRARSYRRARRARIQQDTDDLRRQMAMALATEPTRVPQGLSRAEMDSYAPVSTVGDSLVKDSAECASMQKLRANHLQYLEDAPKHAKNVDHDNDDEEEEEEDDDEGDDDNNYSNSSNGLKTIAAVGIHHKHLNLSSEDGSDSDRLASCQKIDHSIPRRHSADATCPVCLEELKVGDRTRTIIKCGHSFHSKCLRVWLRRDDTCPCCRIKLGQSFAVDGIEVIQRAQLALLYSSMESDHENGPVSGRARRVPSVHRRRTSAFRPADSTDTGDIEPSSSTVGSRVYGVLETAAAAFSRVAHRRSSVTAIDARTHVHQRPEEAPADVQPPPQAVILRASFHRGRRRDDPDNDVVSDSDC